ncbi:histidine kinase N-terminal 7TM domain-containing protein [Halobellus captivus]|uniref:histidine kinase N-terminal 7TM domain-containing protein n=1 Tax=Halobellus captivus TaxID=2592614 RepID=UPI00119E8D72|nr:histidine kinase N-terminal 7TM domain-containing protein [Halobellus captivus]
MTLVQSSPAVLLLFLAATTSLVCGLYGIKKLDRGSRDPYVWSFILLCFAASVWAAVYAVQLSVSTLGAKLLAYKLLHVGGVAVPPAWFVFALSYSGRSSWLTPPTIAGIVAIPVVTLAALPSNPHSLVIASIALESSGGVPTLVTGEGPLYLLHLAYSYVIICAGVGVIGYTALRSPIWVRRQSVLLVTGALVPLALNVANVFEIPPLGTLGINLTPVSLSVSTVLFGVAIFQYGALDLTPVAWNTVLAQMDEGVVVIDERERIVELNRAAGSLLGIPDRALGRPIASVLPQYDRLQRTSDPVTVDRDGSGEQIIQLSRSRLAGHGAMHGWVLILQDVTVPERQRRELAEQNERLDAFARVVSHDLRNPLAVASGWLEIAREEHDSTELRKVAQAQERIQTLIEELLILARQREPLGEDDTATVALGSVARAAWENVETAEARLSVEVEVDVLADPSRLTQLFENVFRNAIDHGGPDVSITVGALDSGFYVGDDGPGIPPEDLDRVLDSGFTTRDGGTGFGLAIVSTIAEAHKWDVCATNGTSGGARIEIRGVEVL